MSVNFSIINSWLRNTAGQQEDGSALFRLVHSAEQVEKRMGLFRDFSSEGLFLREVFEVREVKKYDYLSEQCWVLERFVPSHFNPNQELVRNNGSWEPIWCFLKSDGKAIDPSLKVVQFIVYNIFHADEMSGTERKQHFDSMEAAEQAEMEDMFNGQSRMFDPASTVGYTKEIANDISSVATADQPTIH